MRLLYVSMIIASAFLVFTLVIGEIYLATLGVSWVYLLIGIGFLVTAFLFLKVTVFRF